MKVLKTSITILILAVSMVMADRSTNNAYIITSDNITSVGGFMTNSGTGGSNLLNNMGEAVIATNGNATYWLGQGFLHTFSDAFLQISKTVSNTLLGANASKAIPGSTIIYKIFVTNAGAGDVGYSNTIADKLPANTIYKSNAWTTNNGWAIEWSTNSNPSQRYISSNYTTSESPPGKIRWVRWKNYLAPIYKGARLTYGVIIK
jgi:uncharacterized repeat protein (TIGR01451 family)